MAGEKLAAAELELSCARASHLLVCVVTCTVTWLLPASKTDPEAVGVERTHGCCCGGRDPLPCPYRWAREHLAGYKRPKGVEIWPELPKSAANKILRRKVREIITERDTSTEREA